MEAVLNLRAAALNLGSAGGKGANLRRMVTAGLPVPPGFVITTAAYRAYVETNNLTAVIAEHAARTGARDPASFEAASALIRASFEVGQVPPDLASAIQAAYAELGGGQPALPVAVRSSATAEDLPEASFAGQQETLLNVIGEAALLRAVRRCWSSLWTARAMAYRARQALPPEAVALAVVVQAIVPAEAAGVLFTLNPVTGSRDEVVINAAWGLGEALVAGQVNPDTLRVNKTTGRVNSFEVADKLVMTAPAAEGTAEVEVPAGRRQAFEHWLRVVAPEVLDAHGQPVAASAASASAPGDGLSGVAASRGTVTGVARVVATPRDAGRLQPGEILVTRATDPGWTPVFSLISGVVLEVGGLLSHGAIVAREYGLPAVANVPDATRRIRDGQTITVDGTTGRVTLS